MYWWYSIQWILLIRNWNWYDWYIIQSILLISDWIDTGYRTVNIIDEPTDYGYTGYSIQWILLIRNWLCGLIRDIVYSEYYW